MTKSSFSASYNYYRFLPPELHLDADALIDWRLTLTRDDLDPDKPRVITLEGHSMVLKVAEEK